MYTHAWQMVQALSDDRVVVFRLLLSCVRQYSSYSQANAHVRPIHASAYTHARTHRHTHMHGTCAGVSARTRARTRTHARTHARTHTNSRAHTHTHKHARTHTVEIISVHNQSLRFNFSRLWSIWKRRLFSVSLAEWHIFSILPPSPSLLPM